MPVRRTHSGHGRAGARSRMIATPRYRGLQGRRLRTPRLPRAHPGCRRCASRRGPRLSSHRCESVRNRRLYRHRSCLHHVLAAVGRWRTTVAHHHPRRTRRLGHVRENWDYLSENGQEGSNAGRCRSPQVDIMLLIGQPLKRYRQTSGSLRVAHGDAFCPPGGEQPTVSRCGNELDIVRRDCCGAVGGVVAAQSVKH